jgi:DNA-binding NtrC family response regulator
MSEPTPQGPAPAPAALVLVADDEPNILISLEYLMKREGHRVLLARTGTEARGRIWCCWT